MDPLLRLQSEAGPATLPGLQNGHSSAPQPDGELDTRGFPLAARILLRLLAQLDDGILDLHFPDGQHARYGQPGTMHAQLRLKSWEALSLVLRSGDIGFAQGHIDGLWSTPDLLPLLNLLVLNRKVLERAVYGHTLGRIAYRLRHWFNRNSRAGSRRNIHAHYDIGNAFYRLWLDAGMTYSSALYGELGDGTPAGDEAALEAAQYAKYQRVLDELHLQPGARVLEIGCGWGGLAELAQDQGVHLTGLTLSTEQLEWAQQRCHAQLTDLRLQDYRDCSGQFDGIASIEMFEAVGEAYWPQYFGAIKRMLKPEGRACVQSIVIDESLFDRYRSGSDFIQQYIFPGGMLPSTEAFERAAAKAGLKVVRKKAFGMDYARTLKVWRQRFLRVLWQVRAQGFDERFIRTWDFYLCYCEAAFRQGNTDVVQFTLTHA